MATSATGRRNNHIWSRVAHGRSALVFETFPRAGGFCRGIAFLPGTRIKCLISPAGIKGGDILPSLDSEKKSTPISMPPQQKTLNSRAKWQWHLDSFFKRPPDAPRAGTLPNAGGAQQTPLDLIATFKTDYTPAELKNLWRRLRPGEKFREDHPMLEAGLLFDGAQQVTIVISEQGTQVLEIPRLLARVDCRIYHYFASLLHKQVDRAILARRTVQFAQARYPAPLLGCLVALLEASEGGPFGDQFAIAAVCPSEANRKQWPLVMRSDGTGMLGVLAAFTG